MDPALEFIIDSMNMEFAAHLAGNGHSIPDLPFVDILTEKCGLIRHHIWSHRTYLMLVVNIRPKVASIKIFDKDMLDSQLLHFTVSNIWDLELQLYHLWIEVRGILKDYIPNRHLLA